MFLKNLRPFCIWTAKAFIALLVCGLFAFFGLVAATFVLGMFPTGLFAPGTVGVYIVMGLGSALGAIAGVGVLLMEEEKRPPQSN